MEDSGGVVAGVGAQYLGAVLGEAQGACGAGGGMVFIQGGDSLDQLEGGIFSASVVFVYSDVVFQFADYIGELSVAAEFDDPGGGI